MTRVLILSAVSLALLGCGALAAAPTALPPTLDQSTLENTVYRSADWGEVKLENGIYYRTPLNPLESQETYATKLGQVVVRGDLNEDGLEDAVVFLSTQNGGTGHFVEAAAVINRDGRPENRSTLGLGDRVVIEAGRIEEGTVILDMRVHGPNDGLCCPSQLETWRLRLEGDHLVRQP